ncbi:11743_t:CDS:2 [Dentiscutata erythropus]|uniref:11743_t:CDS:1 n=1 Tax=Dentiscutata erythropus TaxID=1348616 RepID=A0A9N8ZS98_9GLOM|nr:11743_t:CDS:2 [Dentiscutata erythropus]
MASSSFQSSSDNHQVQYQENDYMNPSYPQFSLENYQGQRQFFSEDHSEGHQFSQQKQYQDILLEIHQERYQSPLENNQQYQEIAKLTSFFEGKKSQLNERESQLNKRESQLNERESQLNERESQLNKKESQLKEEGSQHKTANAFLVYLRDILGDDFFLYHNKFLESLQNSSSFLEMKEGKRKAAACDICHGRKKRCVGGKIGEEPCEYCSENKKDCSYIR